VNAWSGPELRKRRLAADIPVRVLAQAMGVSRQTIWIIERRAVVSPETAARYLFAIEKVQPK
jgi:transcriptional regulator with XRE-family HTH domain